MSQALISLPIFANSLFGIMQNTIFPKKYNFSKIGILKCFECFCLKILYLTSLKKVENSRKKFYSKNFVLTTLG